jgi:uncharacterized protein (DUF4415 family)
MRGIGVAQGVYRHGLGNACLSASLFELARQALFIQLVPALHARARVNPQLGGWSTTGVNEMKAEYDLSKMKARRNPYASKLKKPVTMRLSEDVVEYFKSMANEAGVPYQSLINLYLRDCLAQNRKIEIKWPSAA